MSAPEMTAVLQAVFDEICADIPLNETAMRQRVAAKILMAAQKQPWSIADLKQAGRDALNSAPTLWRQILHWRFALQPRSGNAMDATLAAKACGVTGQLPN